MICVCVAYEEHRVEWDGLDWDVLYNWCNTWWTLLCCYKCAAAQSEPSSVYIWSYSSIKLALKTNHKLLVLLASADHAIFLWNFKSPLVKWQYVGDYDTSSVAFVINKSFMTGL